MADMMQIKEDRFQNILMDDNTSVLRTITIAGTPASSPVLRNSFRIYRNVKRKTEEEEEGKEEMHR